MSRNVIIIILVASILVVLGLGGALGYIIYSRSNSNVVQDMEQIKSRKYLIQDKFAGREAEAIEIVKKFQVLDPKYMDAVIEHKKSGAEINVRKKRVTIESLVNKQFLEKRFNMNFLKRGEWRALHLDTDTEVGADQTPDPQYEVYLDYQDEAVTVGPVWIVDLETKIVVPRNAMASIFDRNLLNYATVEENLKRPESVVHAITAHKFDVGIDLGGVFLLHFLKLTSDPKHSNDEIIGWTVMHEFEDDYSAYFQWKELGENKVAKFRFNWASKSLEPKGLLAIDLMAAGENMEKVEPVDIYPREYTNNLGIPRTERWTRGHACRSKDYRDICTAFVKVLEQTEFINAMAWLLTNGEPNANRRVEQCKNDRKCNWVTKIATGENNPKNKQSLVEIGYKYELNNRDNFVRFLVDSEKETITPLDKISQWAYYSVTPRT